jgi:hypothetical protein
VPTTNLSHIPANQSQEQGRITRNRNVNNFKYYTVIDGVLQEKPRIQNPTPYVVSNTTQAGQAERQVLHQNQMIFSSVPSPAALHVGLLNTLFVFKPGSYLKTFLTDKTNVYKTYYSLAEILTILKEVVRGEGLFDPNNPSIILCSTELERALNMKALHVTQIRDQLMDHITEVPNMLLEHNLLSWKDRENVKGRKDTTIS